MAMTGDANLSPQPSGRPRALIVTRVLEPGGAERQLLAMLRNVDTRRIQIAVATLYRGSWHEQATAIPGIEILDLAKQGRYDLIGFGKRLRDVAAAFRPDVIYGYHGGWLPAFALGKSMRRPVVWGLRDADPFPRIGVRRQLVVEQLNRLCARSVVRFIANSYAGAEAYAAAGYPADRMTVVANGIDTDRFVRDPAARVRLRRDWGIADDQVLVGVLGRIDPRKNYGMVVEAVGEIAASNPAVRLAVVGGGDAAYLADLQALAARDGIPDRCVWPGHTEAVAEAMSAFDIFVLPSLSEGFPNALCEAMACGCAVIATDVGDCRRIVADTGTVLAVGDMRGLVEALAGLGAPGSAERRAALGAAARQRIVQKYGTRRMADETATALIETSARAPH